MNKKIGRIPDRIENREIYTEEDKQKLINTWTFYVPTESFEVEILDYYSAFSRCGRGIDNGLAIAIYKEDTIRIIDQCPGRKHYMPEDMLVFTPDKNPPKNNELGIAYIDGQPNSIIFKFPKVTMTTFGYLKQKEKN